jgi:hypothetical protein
MDNIFLDCSVKLICKPCVYIFWKGDQALYVGCSSNGLYRPLDKSHHIARRCIREGDRIVVYAFRTKLEALQYERSEILRLKPSWNGRIIPSMRLCSILVAIDSGEYDSDIAREFDVSRQRIHQIRRKYRNVSTGS